MATAQVSQNRVYLFRLKTLIIDGGTTVVRNILDEKGANVPVIILLHNEKGTINRLRASNTITRTQFDLLFPQSGKAPTTADFDLTLSICLLRSLKCYGLNKHFAWNAIPKATDTSLEADLCRLRMFRMEIAHISSTTSITQNTFTHKWLEIEQVLYRLNTCVRHPVQNLQQLFHAYKNSPLDEESEKIIDGEIKKLRKCEKGLESEVQLVKKDEQEVKREADAVRTEVGKVKDEVHAVTENIGNIKAVHAVTENVGNIKEEVHAVTENVGNIKEMTDAVKEKLNELENEKGAQASSEGSSTIIPKEILRMDDDSIEVYRKALAKGSVPVRDIRIMVVGHHGVGKTALTKRLLGEDVDFNEPAKPTNGIEVHTRRCEIKKNEWIKTEKEQDSKFNQNLSNIKRKFEEAKNPSADRRKAIQTGIRDIGPVPEEKTRLEEQDVRKERQIPEDTGSGIDEHRGENKGTETPEVIQGNESENKMTELLQDLNRQGEKESNRQDEKERKDTTYCTVWDFAGHYAFYNTHQVFFSRRSIYLLVSDMSRDLEAKVDDDPCYIDSSDDTDKLTSLGFMKFWLNSIHEYSSSNADDGHPVDSQLVMQPPVVLVGTKADKYKNQNPEVNDLKTHYFKKVKKKLVRSEAGKHIYGRVFIIDNTFKEIPENIEELRDLLYKLAQQQNYWNEEIPLRYLTLENKLIRLKEQKKFVLKRSEISQLNEEIAEKLTEEELEVFLKLHHETGNLLYFSELKEYILLDPKYLIGAFKLLITDKSMVDADRETFILWEEWNEKAELTDKLLDIMWKGEFAADKKILLMFMEKLGLIAKTPKDNKVYFAPSVLKKKVPKDWIELESSECGTFECGEYTFTSKLCFTTSTKFFPVAIFNRLLAACVTMWDVYEAREETYCLFCGCGIFDLKDAHILYVYFCDNVVQIWIKRPNTKGKAPLNTKCLEVRRFVEKILNSCLPTRDKPNFMCPTAKNGNMYKKDDQNEMKIVECNVHKTELEMKKLTNSWEPAEEYTFLAIEEFRKKQRSPDDNCMFDGRLIMLKEDDIKHLESTCKDDDNRIARGGFGDIYTCGKLFGVPVVVKMIRSDGNQKLEVSAKREMMVARIRHQFILPLLATHRREGTFWFMSPKCEKGDLAKAIQNSPADMDKACRVRILFQLAKAIEYLHTPVKNVRDSIIHKDISSRNILLDDWFNVRLIDFGLAREKNDLTNNAIGRETYTHPDIGKSERASEYWDYYSFGVVMRELLTSLEPDGVSGKYLKNMSVGDIRQNLAAEFKVEGKVSPIADCLNQISNKCLNQIPDKCRKTTKQPVAIFKKEAIDELDGMLRSYGYGTEEKMDPDKCHLCMLNPKGERKKAENHCCINVCVSCEKNSFMNPIKCHCGYEIKPVIGHNWGALLIAGNDKDPDLAKRFESDVSKFKNVITSKAPLVMGVSDDKIQTVLPDGQVSQSMSDKVLKAITNLHSNLETLIIYISCHGKKDDAKGTFTFELSKSKGITLNEFQNALETQLKQLTKVMVFFDCCNPPKISLEGTKVVQINACGSDQRAYAITKDASCFTTFLVQGLTAYAVGNPCGTSGCKKCKEYWHHRTDYVTVGNLIRYINGHMDVNQTAKIHMIEGTHDDINIAYYTDEEMQIKFTETDSKDTADGNEIELQLEFFKTMKKIKEELRRRFDKHKSDYNVTIKSGTFRKDVEFKECNSIEKVILAWVYRLPLYVTFKKPVEPEQPEATPSVPEPVEETPKPAVPEEPVAEKTTESETPSPTPTDENIPKVEIKIEDENDKLEEGEIVDHEEEETMSMGLRYKYSEEQWSPLNPEGKKHYDRDFLLQFQNDYNAIQKPAGLPDILDIILDKKKRSQEKQGEGGNPDEAQSSNAGNYIAVVVGIGLIIGGIIIQKVLGGSF